MGVHIVGTPTLPPAMRDALKHAATLFCKISSSNECDCDCACLLALVLTGVLTTGTEGHICILGTSDGLTDPVTETDNFS